MIYCEEIMDSLANPEKKLSNRVLISYGFGHMSNDLTSSMWFSYLLVFFHYVLNFSSSSSGILLLIGQLADGLATPVVGILSDKGAGYWLCRYGHRKTWHLIGKLIFKIFTYMRQFTYLLRLVELFI